MRKKQKNTLVAILVGAILIAAIYLLLTGGGLSTIQGGGTCPVIGLDGEIVGSFSELRSILGQSYTDAELISVGYMQTDSGIYSSSCGEI